MISDLKVEKELSKKRSEKGEAVISQVTETIDEYEGNEYELSKVEVTFTWEKPTDDSWGPSTDDSWGEKHEMSTFACCYRNGVWTCSSDPCDN